MVQQEIQILLRAFLCSADDGSLQTFDAVFSSSLLKLAWNSGGFSLAMPAHLCRVSSWWNQPFLPSSFSLRENSLLIGWVSSNSISESFVEFFMFQIGKDFKEPQSSAYYTYSIIAGIRNIGDHLYQDFELPSKALFLCRSANQCCTWKKMVSLESHKIYNEASVA